MEAIIRAQALNRGSKFVGAHPDSLLQCQHRNDFYNDQRCHYTLDSETPIERTGKTLPKVAHLDSCRWRSHCRGLYHLPVAACARFRHRQVPRRVDYARRFIFRQVLKLVQRTVSCIVWCWLVRAVHSEMRRPVMSQGCRHA